MPLVARPRHRLRRRQQFRRPRPGPRHHRPGNPHQPAPARCKSLRGPSRAHCALHWPPGAEGRAIAQAEDLALEPCYAVAQNNRARLVWPQASQDARDRLGRPPRAIRWVLVRDPEGKRDPQVFFSTDIARAPADIIALFVRRWQVEVTFAETRAHLAVGLRSAEHGQHTLCRGLVSQDQHHLHRRHRFRAPRIVGRRYFSTLSAQPETAKNPARPRRPHGRGSMLRRIMCKVELRAGQGTA